MELRHIKLDSVDMYNKMYGLTTRHPLVSVVNLKDATSIANNFRLEYGLYALFLKNGVSCSIKYGRKKYDYQEGTVVSFAPGQIVDVELKPGDMVHNVTGIEDITTEAEGNIEFFNLQGVRVEGELTPGVYIRRQGSTTSKVYIR